MSIVIPPAPFNTRVFEIPVPITRGGKIFSSYPPRCEYYSRVSVGAGFFDIPNRRTAVCRMEAVRRLPGRASTAQQSSTPRLIT